ncbi:MAG: galactoside O-acetyltransferase [Bacteriovoracaceae bacterium]|jgi:galactoside O-acetyltransferase
MIKLVLFFAKLLFLSFRKLNSKFYVFRSFGFILPLGAIVSIPENIEIGEGFGISQGCMILAQGLNSGSQVKIGRNVKLNFNVMINADNGGVIEIGDDVLIGPNVVMRAANHKFDSTELAICQQGHSAGNIKIGNNVWLGSGVTILPNVSVGEGSIVAAGAVVTKDVPAFSITAGVPAKVIKNRLSK